MGQFGSAVLAPSAFVLQQWSKRCPLQSAPFSHRSRQLLHEDPVRSCPAVPFWSDLEADLPGAGLQRQCQRLAGSSAVAYGENNYTPEQPLG
eukprot:3844199-Alexandrium_andersonii.AAC.1